MQGVALLSASGDASVLADFWAGSFASLVAGVKQFRALRFRPCFWDGPGRPGIAMFVK